MGDLSIHVRLETICSVFLRALDGWRRSAASLADEAALAAAGRAGFLSDAQAYFASSTASMTGMLRVMSEEVASMASMSRLEQLVRASASCMCYTEKAPNAWQRQGTQKTRNTYNQPNRPNRKTYRPSTKRYRKDSPGDAEHQLTQQPCTLQHNPPSAPTLMHVFQGATLVCQSCMLLR